MSSMVKYLTDGAFYIHFSRANLQTIPISAGVPQCSVLGSILYLLYTINILEQDNTIIATFTNDIAVFSLHKD